MHRILCVGDGFAHGHIWPEWPQILRAVAPKQQVEIISGIGAGNEFLISSLLRSEPNHDQVIFQWAQAHRLDKIVQDQQWLDLAESDPVYAENFYYDGRHRWWLSSASRLSEITKYHKFYIQDQQSFVRLKDQKKLLRGFLVGSNCNYIEISTQEQNEFSRASRFKDLRGKEVQPSPPVHFAYLIEKILDQLALDLDHQRLNRMQKLIYDHSWKAYDPDRASIWEKMVKDLDTA